MLQQNAPQDTELRLALGMRGGVSLAVWIGGACAEIDELRRAADTREGFWWRLLEASPYSRVTVDVMAGASAGGLNGVLFAAAMRHGFRMDELLRVWRRVADVNALRRKSDPWISLFDGDDRFLDVVSDALDRFIDGKNRPEADQAAQTEIKARQLTSGYIDLQLSATLVEPIDSAAISPGDERLRRSRSSARFHFRHDPSAIPARLDIEASDVPRLAVAARGTASFPVAFEAAVVRATRPEVFEIRPTVAPGVETAGTTSEDQRRARRRLVDCRNVFSESRGAAKTGDIPFGDEDFVVADGGVVDNIPLGKALDAVRDAPASGPTRRVLVYLHPTGPATVAKKPTDRRPGESADERAIRRRGPESVLRGLVASKVQSESIDGDIERLEQHNRAVRLGRMLRQSLLAELVPAPTAEDDSSASTSTDADTETPSPVGLARLRLSGYLVQRASADADAIQALLSDPLAVIGDDPFPAPPESVGDYERAEDRWRSPIAGWTSDQRLALDTSLREQFVERLGHRQLGMNVLVGGLGPIIRSIDLLLELAREGEKQDPDRTDEIGAMKPALYKLGSYVRELQRIRDLAWVCEAGRLERDGDVGEWVQSTLTQLRRLHGDSADVIAALADPTSDDFARAARAQIERRAADLQILARGAPLPERAADADLRKALIGRLEGMADQLLAQLPSLSAEPVDAYSPRARSGAEVIQRILLDPTGDWPERLASLEVLLLDEQLVGAPGHVEIGFTRMSAAAPIIGADRFTQLYEFSQAYDDSRVGDPDYLAPDVKLAGNELASFSAFLDDTWRVNDWTWGRLDATATLIDLLLAEDRTDRDDLDLDLDALFALVEPDTLALVDEQSTDPSDRRKRLRRALTAQRQNELLKGAVEDGLPEDLGEWNAGLETLVNPGSPSLTRAVTDLADVGARVVGAVLPPSVPRIVAPLQSVLRLIVRRIAKPTGTRPEPVRSPTGGTDDTTGKAASALISPALAIISILVGAGLAALAYAAADQTVSLAIGLVIGLVVGLVPGAILLWLSIQPVRPRRGPHWLGIAVSAGVILGAGVAVTVVAVLRAWL